MAPSTDLPKGPGRRRSIFGTDEIRSDAQEIDTSVNRQGCTLCSDLKIPPSGTIESTAEPQKTVPPGGPQIGEREHGELGALKTE